MDERAWPFPILKPEAEWTEFDRDYVDLMRAAYAEGYGPRDGPCGCVDLGRWPEGRSVSLVRRGSRNGWEPFIGESGTSVRLGPSFGLPLGEYACVCVRPPFRGATHLALEWMRGRPLASLLRDFEFVGGYPAGIVLRPEVVPSPRVLPGQDAERGAAPDRRTCAAGSTESRGARPVRSIVRQGDANQVDRLHTDSAERGLVMADGMYEILALIPKTSDFTLERAVEFFAGKTFSKSSMGYKKHPLRAELTTSPGKQDATGFRIFFGDWAIVAWLETEGHVLRESQEMAETANLPSQADVIAGCDGRLSIWSDEDRNGDWTDQFNDYWEKLQQRFGVFVRDNVNGRWWK